VLFAHDETGIKQACKPEALIFCLNHFLHNITINVFDCGPINFFSFPMKNTSEVLLRELRYAVLAQLSNNNIYILHKIKEDF